MVTSQATRDVGTILADNIRAARNAMGLTQRQLATRVNGIDSLAVSRWERKIATPSDENFAALCEVTGHDHAWFYTDHAHGAAA